MKKAAVVLMGFVFMFACQQPGVQTEPIEIETPRDGVFIHITHDHNNPHRVLMPLQMAILMADDKDVLIYLDIDAVNLVIKDAEDIAYGHFTPLKESLSDLLEKGVGIYACPGCMKIADIKENDLMEGIQLAQKDRFFDFTEGKIISLTY
ncbi:MAG: peroxiredoxin [Bacteroidetes bacterium]|nr:MAG: peroxiredoxin [Bacteroidota bacterium]